MQSCAAWVEAARISCAHCRTLMASYSVLKDLRSSFTENSRSMNLLASLRKSAFASLAVLVSPYTATAKKGLLPKKWTCILYLITSYVRSLFLYHRKHQKSLWSSFTTKQWNMCSMLAVMATCSFLNLISTPSRLLLRSEPVSKTSLSYNPSYGVLESKNIWILSSFLR